LSSTTKESAGVGIGKKELAIEWRRGKVLEYSSMGYNQSEIAKMLQISEPTISQDVKYLRGDSREALQEYISKKMPDEIRKTFLAMDLILKTAWNTVNTTEDEKTRLNALALINQVMASRLQLLANVDVVDQVINLVTDIKDKQKKAEQQQGESEEAAVAEEFKLQKSDMSYDDIFDSFRLALTFYRRGK
jgi:predicted transcriptional regulator